MDAAVRSFAKDPNRFETPPVAIMISLEYLLSREPWPLPVPVLGFGPSSLFESVPDGSCDDFIDQDFSSSELRYRLSRISAGTHSFGTGRILRCRPFVVSASERSEKLTSTEYRMVALLLRADGGVVPRGALAAVLPRDSAAEGRAVDMHISRLRRKLQRLSFDWDPPLDIASDRGGGYALVS